MTKFAERLKQLRTDAGLSQHALASQLGSVTKSSINMYERGEREPCLEYLVALAKFFGVTTDYLLGASAADVTAAPDPDRTLRAAIAYIVKDLTSEDAAALVPDVREYIEFKSQQRKRK